MKWRATMRAIELIAESNIMDVSIHDVPYILPHKKEALSTAGLVVHHNSRQVAYYDLFQRLGGVSSIDIYIRYIYMALSAFIAALRAHSGPTPIIIIIIIIRLRQEDVGPSGPVRRLHSSL